MEPTAAAMPHMSPGRETTVSPLYEHYIHSQLSIHTKHFSLYILSNGESLRIWDETVTGVVDGIEIMRLIYSLSFGQLAGIFRKKVS